MILANQIPPRRDGKFNFVALTCSCFFRLWLKNQVTRDARDS